jgi:hypothetical protein
LTQASGVGEGKQQRLNQVSDPNMSTLFVKNLSTCWRWDPDTENIIYEVTVEEYQEQAISGE